EHLAEALDNKLLDRRAFGKLEKPRIGQWDRLPTAGETAAILSQGAPEVRPIYSAPRPCGARPGGIRRAKISHLGRTNSVITLPAGRDSSRFLAVLATRQASETSPKIECCRRAVSNADLAHPATSPKGMVPMMRSKGSAIFGRER